jgi:TonB family protein
VAPILAELAATLTRRFRPATPDDTAARVIVTVSSDGLYGRSPGIDAPRIPLAARLAVTAANSELEFGLPPGAKPVEFIASFEPRCVVEFPAVEANVPTEQAYFEFQVERTVQPLSGKAPEYPPALLESHIGGRVLAQFVVDTSGVPDMRTFKVLESPSAMFSEAVREAVRSMRYVPAMYKGRRVRQVVQQPFVFAVRE